MSISRVSKISIFSGGRSKGRGVGRQNFRPVGQVFSACFEGKKQHRNIFSHDTGRLAKFGWILTYLKISLEMAVTWLLPGAFQLSSVNCMTFFSPRQYTGFLKRSDLLRLPVAMLLQYLHRSGIKPDFSPGHCLIRPSTRVASIKLMTCVDEHCKVCTIALKRERFLFAYCILSYNSLILAEYKCRMSN